MSNFHDIKTVGDLKKIIANMSDDTKICLKRRLKFGYDYDWGFEFLSETLRNQYDGCGPCDDALRAPKSAGIQDCPEHSGPHFIIRY